MSPTSKISETRHIFLIQNEVSLLNFPPLLKTFDKRYKFMVIFCESIISNQGKEDSHIQEKGSVGDMVGRVSSLSTEARICEPPPSEHCTVECGVALFTSCQSRIRNLPRIILSSCTWLDNLVPGFQRCFFSSSRLCLQYCKIAKLQL